MGREQQQQGPRQQRAQGATRRPGSESGTRGAHDGNRSGLVKITGLWLHEKTDTNTGEVTKYMTGKMGAAVVFVFRNTQKRKGSDPDYGLFLAPDRAPSERTRDAGDL